MNSLLPFGRGVKRARGQEDKEDKEDKRTRGQEDKRSRGQEIKRTRDQEDKKEGNFIFGVSR
jgi:hypothetical protein